MLDRYTLFRSSKAASQTDNTTRISKGITDDETSAREAKTLRLRTARLERGAAEMAQRATSPQIKSRKKSPAKAQPQS